MNNFSIKDIEMLSGIKAHTFRIWEQRHGLTFCKRKDSLHRYYDNDDLKAVLRIAYLYHNGFKISKIAGLTQDEIIKLAYINIEEPNYDQSIHQLIEANLDYDQLRFDKITQNVIARFGFEKSIVKVFYPFMERVGKLWVTEHLIPAQEHFSSSLIQQKMLVAIDKVRSITVDRKETVLIFAPEGELHEIPLLVALYLLKKNGIKTVYFGVNITLEHVAYYCSHKKITHLYFNLITNFLNKEPAEYIDCLVKKFPGINIIASGSALKNCAPGKPGVKIVRAIEDLINCF